jgi:hypothetical protein
MLFAVFCCKYSKLIYVFTCKNINIYMLAQLTCKSGAMLAAAAQLRLPCHKAARQFVVNAAAAARNARAPRGQKNATRIFALLFFPMIISDGNVPRMIISEED